MSSPDKKPNHASASEKLVSVETSDLKEKLNHLYSRMRESALTSSPEPEHFDSLWDLKELALMQGRQSVEVPLNWLAEAEEQDSRTCLKS